jgi:hypothetical protein
MSSSKAHGIAGQTKAMLSSTYKESYMPQLTKLNDVAFVQYAPVKFIAG